MEENKYKIFQDYISHLYSSGKSYNYIGRYIKIVKLFLESDFPINRIGYKKYLKSNAILIIDEPLTKEALCDFLNFLGIEHSKSRKGKDIKPLEKLCTVSDKNKKMINDFIYYLTQEEDYSPHTLQIYAHSVKKYFEYANEISVDNYKRFVKMLEDEGFSPQTIRLRITALEKLSKFIKKPIELKRPKFGRKLNTENVPTENDYNKLLTYLQTKKNQDHYFFIKMDLRFSCGDNYRMHEHIRVSAWEDLTPQMESVALKTKLWAQETFEEICEMIDIKLACEDAIEKKDKEVRTAFRWAVAGWLTSIALFGILVAAFVFK
jgi:hypothetical protein